LTLYLGQTRKMGRAVANCAFAVLEGIEEPDKNLFFDEACG